MGVRETEIVILMLVTVISVAAGAELVYFALAGQSGPAAWSACFFAAGLLSGRLLWP